MYGADPQAVDLAHWFRVPGSINSKYAHIGNGAPSFREHIHEDRIDLEDLAFPLGARRLTGDLTPARNRRKPADNRSAYRPGPGAGGKRIHANQHSLNALVRLNDLRGGIGELSPVLSEISELADPRHELSPEERTIKMQELQKTESDRPHDCRSSVRTALR